MRMDAVMMRYWFSRYLSAILNGLAVATLVLLIAAIFARKIGVAELRGSLP